jgi:hypothetical protein
MQTLENKTERGTMLFPSKLVPFAVLPLVALAFTLVIGAFNGQAVAQSAGNSDDAFAVGGFLAIDGSQVAFAAHILPNPNNNNTYAGHVVQTDTSGVSRHGPVTCVTVCPPMAVVVWEVAKSDNSGEVGQVRSFEVMDNGEPPTGMDMYKDRGIDMCCGFRGSGAYVPVVRGNIVVKGPACGATPLCR